MRHAQGLDQGDHGVAAGLGLQLDVRYGESLADPGAFDDDHRLAKSLVGEQVAGSCVAGPEQ